MRSEEYLLSLLSELRSLPKETGWVEFKHNNNDLNTIGQYISALSNTAALFGKNHAYMVWGIEDDTHNIVGTDFKPSEIKKGNEELESWLLRLLNPRINFVFHELKVDDKRIVILEIERAMNTPVRFDGSEYIRIGSYKKSLKDFPEKERELWRIFGQRPFEEMIACDNVPEELVLSYLDYPSYFELLDIPLPENRKYILEQLMEDQMIVRTESGGWHITNLGAALFAKNLSKFTNLKRKSVRVIIYKGKDRIETQREQEGVKGYASGFEGLIGFIDNLLPRNEVIGKALRKEVPMYPELAVRELVANAIIHQDFSLSGTGPTIEVFSDRMEITNPGIPLVKKERFLDSPPRSRNETLASFLRRVGICEERGSGIDKVVSLTELYQLPAPLIEVTDSHTRVTLFAYKPFAKMERKEKIHACYLHASLKYVTREHMTNATLRQRFGLADKNNSIASRIIRDAVEVEVIKPLDPDTAPRYMKYVPFWA
ncbi:ATP-binding protein [Bacillus cereus group sp. BfR-BA-01379]|uniref:ATP-binding protein n=1 Tax=Bacillus cereus group sp. BfR-BA-01379 TaxID=2920323 RepID=UPI001F5AF606|nr:ATP-binding protein [Bacillus cereus group sp. BfR-BA-01379]